MLKVVVYVKKAMRNTIATYNTCMCLKSFFSHIYNKAGTHLITIVVRDAFILIPVVFILNLTALILNGLSAIYGWITINLIPHSTHAVVKVHNQEMDFPAFLNAAVLFAEIAIILTYLVSLLIHLYGFVKKSYAASIAEEGEAI